jgi:hypothetical protein
LSLGDEHRNGSRGGQQQGDHPRRETGKMFHGEIMTPGRGPWL